MHAESKILACTYPYMHIIGMSIKFLFFQLENCICTRWWNEINQLNPLTSQLIANSDSLVESPLEDAQPIGDGVCITGLPQEKLLARRANFPSSGMFQLLCITLRYQPVILKCPEALLKKWRVCVSWINGVLHEQDKSRVIRLNKIHIFGLRNLIGLFAHGESQSEQLNMLTTWYRLCFRAPHFAQSDFCQSRGICELTDEHPPSLINHYIIHNYLFHLITYYRWSEGRDVGLY